MAIFKGTLQRWFNTTDSNEETSGWKPYLLYALIAVLITIFTFPKYFPETQIGLDGSEIFALNYSFCHNIQFGSQIIFTYGPLGFLWSPTAIGNNLLVAIIFSNIIRFVFVYSFLMLGNIINKSHRILHLVLVIGICNMMYLDMALIGTALIAILIYHQRKEIAWLIIGCLMAALGLLVKSSYGMICLSILLSYAFFTSIFNKRPIVILYVSAFTSLFFLFTWFLLYHNLSGLSVYFHAMYEFGKDNSNAYQEEVTNHWGLVCLSGIFFFLPLLFTKNKLTRIFYLITIASIFAAFKYSFAREENWHQLFLFTYLIMLCAIFLVLNSNIKILAVMLPLASISFLYANMVKTNAYNIDDRKRITGIGNFITFALDYNTVIKNTRISDSLTLKSKILDGEQRALIENNTVDCYPMELDYVAANTLNWNPRPTLQILDYTPWLDSRNASFFNSADAPRFYIWELEQPPENNYSVDDHYLLNEEPRSIYSFYNHYKLITNNTKTAIFKRSDTPLLGDERKIITTNGYVNKWLDVIPNDSTTVLRAQIHFINTLKGTLRKIFYKDQLYFIDYMLENGTIKSYRLVPGNAISGLWINPLVIDITKGLKGGKVKFIRIRVSRDECIENNFLIDWTSFRIKR